MLMKTWQFAILHWIVQKIIVQGSHHRLNITAYYRVMAEEARKQFNEDGPWTLDTFLKEFHDRSLLTEDKLVKELEGMKR